MSSRFYYKPTRYKNEIQRIKEYIIIHSPSGRRAIRLTEAIDKDFYEFIFNDEDNSVTIENNDKFYFQNTTEYQTIKDIVEPVNITPTYSVSPSSSSVNEGSTVTYTVTTTNVANGTTLYWTNSGTTVAGDFSDSLNSGSFTVTSGSGTITRTLTNDVTTEGGETIILQIRTGSTSGTIVATSSTVTIGDTSLSPATGGSMLFDYNTGVAGTYVRYPNNSNLAIGTSSFTIEWFQYWQSGGSFPRVFSIGTYPSANIAVSYEGSIFYFWRSSSAIAVGSVPSQNAWVHVAIVGESGSSIKIYVNGVQRGSTITGSYNFNNTSTALTIGNESTAGKQSNFTGRITNFRWVKGTAIYTTNNFTVPTAPLTAVSGTQLLLLATNNAGVVTDSSSAARTATNTGVTFSSTTPF